MFMWIAIIAFLFNVFTFVIWLSFHDQAKDGDRLAMRIHFVLGLCIFIGVIVMIVFLIAAVRYE